ncbi:MAG: GNAT family N-acetyltransferase [Armatimonadetes bacterium]|nr:GNAT family N-acetyltransferase [Armatimonadota bacterium]
MGCIFCKEFPEKEKAPHGEVETGWHLGQEFWGYGYATEAAKAVANFGFEKDPALERLMAVVYTENTASRRVAEKIGMKHLGKMDWYYGVPLEVYELIRPG